MLPSDLPSLRTERLFLRPLDAGDAADVLAYCSDPDVARYTSWEPHRSIEDSAGFIDFCQAHASTDESQLFVPLAICIGEGPVIGTVTLGRTPDGARVDFAVARDAWNQGIVTEAASALIDWAFSSYPWLEVVESGGMGANPASMRVMEKLGMSRTAIRTIDHPKFPDPIEIWEWEIRREGC